MALDALGQISRADAHAVGIGVADGIYLRNHREIGVTEAGGEIIQEKFGAAVLVGLENADEPAGMIFFSKGTECRANFGGVMAVIIDDECAVGLAHFGHA